MSKENFNEDEFCSYSGLPSPMAYMPKTSTITLDSIKDSDGWYSMAHDLGLEAKAYDIFEYGEYASLTITVDENLNIIGGKIHPYKPLT